MARWRRNTEPIWIAAENRQAALEEGRLPEPEMEKLAVEMARARAGDAGHRWKGYAANLRECREIVRHRVSP